MVSDALAVRGISVTCSATYKWVRRYSKIAGLFTESLKPRVGNWYRGDEVWVRVNGQKYYLFATMMTRHATGLPEELADSKDRHDAYGIFRATSDAAGKDPSVLIIDSLPAYQKAARKVFGRRT